MPNDLTATLKQALVYVRHCAGGPDADDATATAEAIERALADPKNADVFLLKAHVARQIGWSRETFGPGARTKGVVEHVRKELREIEAAPHDLSEWIDVMILGIDGAWRCIAMQEPDLTDDQLADRIVSALVTKQDRNYTRRWPDWRTMSQDDPIEHDRNHD